MQNLAHGTTLKLKFNTFKSQHSRYYLLHTGAKMSHFLLQATCTTNLNEALHFGHTVLLTHQVDFQVSEISINMIRIDTLGNLLSLLVYPSPNKWLDCHYLLKICSCG